MRLGRVRKYVVMAVVTRSGNAGGAGVCGLALVTLHFIYSRILWLLVSRRVRVRRSAFCKRGLFRSMNLDSCLLVLRRMWC